MSEIDPITGLPKDLGVWETITKESQKITAKIVKKKFGKQYTLVQGFETKEVDLKDVVKKLKSKFACGGTTKDNYVELQGNHLGKIKQALIDLGFQPETIDVK
ncbi:stress response translation initiation inhibitor YciH [Candidatus Woesearchaeota archaeon]|nr:MAG: stress response translation initiation inhibitor YciH [Candidatus Woesearchaeota archaeon]